MKKITVVGMGYVGLSNLLLFSPHHEITGYEINSEKLNLLKNCISPIKDHEIVNYLTKYFKNIHFTGSQDEAFRDADLIIIATPTDYDHINNYFDTSSISKTIKVINKIQPKAVVLIKSTIPFGFTKSINSKYPDMSIIFSPEFLREGKALFDNLHPSRIVVGDKTEVGQNIANLFKSAAQKKDITIICTGSDEAEAIKLFANNYLAMRVAYFNELDSFAIKNNLTTEDIINGISSDPRIGSGYNNPSFGYGGYCLPKDTKQLLANFSEVPQNLIKAIVDSNETRKKFITHSILKTKPKVIGVYRLIMKEGSDNFRSSSIQDIVFKLKAKNLKIIIYEPSLNEKKYKGLDINNDIDDFTKKVDIIIANRIDKNLKKYSNKIFTRDLFHEN